MSKIVSGLFISLDGVVESPEKLRLVDSKTLSTGVLYLTYGRADAQVSGA